MKLTKAERNALRLYHLGGAAAWRTETAKVACATINSLFRKRFFDRNGITEQGKSVARQVAEEDHERTRQNLIGQGALEECGCCGHLHRIGYTGDCRNDLERF